MKSKEQNNVSKSGGEGAFDKLLASKKVIQRNRMGVHFSSDLSQLPIPSTEELLTTRVRADKNTSEQLSPTKKVITKKGNPSTNPPSQPVAKPINEGRKTVEVKNINTIQTKKIDPNKQTITSPPASNEATRIPTFKPAQVLENTQNQQAGAPLKTVPIKQITPVPTVEEMKSIDQSTSSHINVGGASAAKHVTDSPYTEQPVSKEGKNLIPRSQEVHDILSYVPSWMVRWGNTVILLIVGGILVMCYYIKYPDVVQGVVSLNSTYPPVSLVAKATGAVQLFKEDKTPVLSEEPIGVIKNTATYKDVQSLKTVLIDFQDKLDKGSSFSFYELPKGLRIGELQNSYNQLFLKLKEQRIQYQSGKNNTQRKGNINQQLAELEAIQKAKEQSLSIKYQGYLKAKHLLDTRHKILYEKGSISAEQLNAKENEVRNLLDIYQNDRMTFNEIKKRILDLNSNKAELDFQKKDQQILSQSSLIAAYEELKFAIESWEKRYVLKAPIDGTLNFIKFIKNDMYLQQEQALANIIPTRDMEEEGVSMTGELIIPSIGAGKAAIGQVVNVELNDYPKKQYGVILGEVESIDNVAVSIPDGSGIAGYKVMVTFPNGLESTLKKDIHFKHNMQGKAEIITEDIRLLERFFHELRELADAD